MNMGKEGHEHGEPHRAQGTFSVFEIKKKKKKTHKKKTQPINTLKQLVCFIGVWGKGRKERYHSGEKLVCGPRFFKDPLNLGCA